MNNKESYSRQDRQKSSNGAAKNNQASENIGKFKFFINRLNKLNKLSDLDSSQLVEMAHGIGEALSKCKVQSRKLRKFHGHIVRFAVKEESKEIKRKQGGAQKGENNKDIQDIQLLRYHLKYAASRVDNNAVNKLADFFEAAIKKVSTLEDLTRFKQLSEAIIAFHKYEEKNKG